MTPKLGEVLGQQACPGQSPVGNGYRSRFGIDQRCDDTAGCTAGSQDQYPRIPQIQPQVDEQVAPSAVPMPIMGTSRAHSPRTALRGFSRPTRSAVAPQPPTSWRESKWCHGQRSHLHPRARELVHEVLRAEGTGEAEDDAGDAGPLGEDERGELECVAHDEVRLERLDGRGAAR